MNNKVILHIDMDAFFASVEQHLNPKLLSKPVVVAGNHSVSTVVTAASYEARRFGISSGMPLTTALKLCPWAIVVRGNPVNYALISEKIFNILFDFSPDIECSSIDEAFVDITNTHKFFNGPENTAHKIKLSIYKKTGLKCSIGIAPNKLMAKLASTIIKPDGIKEIKDSEINEILRDLPVGKLCGIGKKTQQKLMQTGIFTCKQLASFPVRELRRIFGINGIKLHQMSRGIGSTKVLSSVENQPVQSIGNSHSLNRPTFNTDILKAVIMALSEKVSYRLQKINKSANCITLTIRYADFKTITISRQLENCTNESSYLFKNTIKILKKELPVIKQVRMLGITCSKLGRYSFQPDFFAMQIQKPSLNQAIYNIKNKFGTEKIKKCSMLIYPDKHIFSLYAENNKVKANFLPRTQKNIQAS